MSFRSPPSKSELSFLRSSPTRLWRQTPRVPTGSAGGDLLSIALARDLGTPPLGAENALCFAEASAEFDVALRRLEPRFQPDTRAWNDLGVGAKALERAPHPSLIWVFDLE